MKTLTLIRHAKSEWDDPEQRDFDRPLNPRGRRAARTVGEWLRGHGLRVDAAVASPAARVRQTVAELADAWGHELEPVWDARIYLASAATLMEVVSEADDAAASLLLVGHNPGLEDLVLRLAGAGDALDEVAEKFPTVSVAELSLPIDRWARLADGQGRLDRFTRPRDLDPTLGPDSR